MIKLFLAGDVMLGRAIDQILRHPGDPQLYEDYLHSARDYVRLAEREMNGHAPSCGAFNIAARDVQART
jgi:poly-gamma-glutamate synthesis protein (capsule biosynthesis protein)